jgi:hypothetical protein
MEEAEYRRSLPTSHSRHERRAERGWDQAICGTLRYERPKANEQEGDNDEDDNDDDDDESEEESNREGDGDEEFMRALGGGEDPVELYEDSEDYFERDFLPSFSHYFNTNSIQVGRRFANDYHVCALLGCQHIVFGEVISDFWDYEGELDLYMIFDNILKETPGAYDLHPVEWKQSLDDLYVTTIQARERVATWTTKIKSRSITDDALYLPSVLSGGETKRPRPEPIIASIRWALFAEK